MIVHIGKWETLVPISLDKENPVILLENHRLNLSEHAISVLKKWIITHYDGLMEVWNGEISESAYVVGMRYMKWRLEQNPDKEILEKILSLNMY